MPSSKSYSGLRVGEYQIVNRIGTGGMGIVYEGQHPIIGKRVAVKVLRANLSKNAQFVERFIAEARAVNEIRHRGIVDIFGFGTLEDGSHYFVMEFLEGTPFDRIMKTRGPLPVVEVLAWTEQICAALHAAHQANVIHRDIKPSNLFLVDTGREPPYVKLLDFGIAKLGMQGSSPLTQAGLAVGTPDFMSPEQAKGLPITPRADIYALGCLMFEMLAARHVFVGENDVQTIVKHIQEEPPHLVEVRPDVPDQLDQLVWWMMRKSPDDRPASAELLGRALLSLRQQLEPHEAPPVPRASAPRASAPRASAPRLTDPRGSGEPLNTPVPVPRHSATREIELALADELAEPEPLTVPGSVVIDDDDEPPPPRRWGLLAVALLLALGGGGYAYVKVLGGALPFKLPGRTASPPPTPVEPAPPQPTPPTVEEPTEPSAPAQSPAKKAPPKKGVRSGPAKTSVTRAALFQRMFLLEKRLAGVDDSEGTLLQRLTEARSAARNASTNEERLEVDRTLDELELLLPP